MKTQLPLSEVYAILEPGPVLLLGTAQDGRANLMAMSWHCMLEFEPPLVGCVVSAANYSFAALQATGECVLNVPTDDLVRQLVGCGNSHGDETDKFARFRLTAVPSARVAVPRVAECYANLECRVADRQLVGSYNFFILEVLQAWHDPAVTAPRTLHHRGYGRFMLAGEEIQLDSAMR
ncbi:flavin reductase domain-containing protein [Pseudomonas sp. BAY1663]|uniref:flavin reductase family protein n=1 Tax=Pseudomonas sp. BAY1663 TaxID=1439940 RepID=UPI00042DE3C5|nr:flavin reductase family protein [Pseudomonas sp. BAY1663]EXF44137.1 flavin reductase domain-containing protein [Pseudomonas sp. BAY1663]